MRWPLRCTNHSFCSQTKHQSKTLTTWDYISEFDLHWLQVSPTSLDNMLYSYCLLWSIHRRNAYYCKFASCIRCRPDDSEWICLSLNLLCIFYFRYTYEWRSRKLYHWLVKYRQSILKDQSFLGCLDNSYIGINCLKQIEVNRLTLKNQVPRDKNWHDRFHCIYDDQLLLA